MKEGSRYTILLNTEINRLRHGRPLAFLHNVAQAVQMPIEGLQAFAGLRRWQERVRNATYPKEVGRCPNPRCGAPVGHFHNCG